MAEIGAKGVVERNIKKYLKKYEANITSTTYKDQQSSVSTYPREGTVHQTRLSERTRHPNHVNLRDRDYI